MERQNHASQHCCAKNDGDTNAGPSCSCASDCGTAVDKKTAKIAICLVALLAVGGILAYKTIPAGNNAVARNDNVALAYAQEISGSTTANAAIIKVNQADLNFGKRLESLSDLNKVALNEDIVFVFIPASTNDLADNVTSASALAAQKNLKESKVAAGLYTLLRSSPDYPELAKQVETPAILVARKGGKMVAMKGDNVSENKLLQAYLACCDESGGSSCCPATPPEQK